ncbi:MAG TPA: AarF/ABC1/UbiB kinase family protein [Pyrinomonadaceae bacterium]|nr:AarF/ABC1/UbiB kinase family protein [Pyrinomonadaceae bacterium]
MGHDKDSSLQRAFSMATVGVSIAGSYLGYALQRAFLDETESKAKLRSTHVRTARRMADEMKSLRGVAMKFGQTLSLQTGTLPDEMLAELATLQMKAPGMHPSLVRAQFRQSMGAEPEEIFKKFDPKSFAAASLGQVHHALTREGERVAVKIQYPGVRDAIRNDFKTLRAITKPAQTTGHIPRTAIDEVEEQILAETDYHREGENIEFFRKSLASIPFVKVPRYLPAYSSDRVLTMTFLPGVHIDDFLAQHPSEKLRNELGARLFELFYFQVLEVGALHADPHWGNYLFSKDARIGLVDFGCAKHLLPESVTYLKRGSLYPGSTHSAEFRRLLEIYYKKAGRTLPAAARQALIRFADNFYRKVYPPDAGSEQSFDFADQKFLQVFLAESRNLFRTKGVPPDLIFMARAEMGLYQTLHRLKARVHTSRIVRKYL